ncbi:MAG: hypothetical protein CME64_17750 [Halobacteriovoraceae bacterium]|nr:hypothetical protein [Halobacteriovoraceae bacterium]
MKIPASAKANANLDEATFNSVIDKVSEIYAPIFSQLGATLKVNRNWDDGTVNAYASRSGSEWNIHMFGGLARHEAVTPDGFALVVCHELGHHIGGAPKKGGWWSNWATNEGQADYFATLKCLRRSFRGEDHNAVLSKMQVPKMVVDTCAEQWTSEEDQLICQRGAMAGHSTAKLFQALRRQTTPPKFDTPDPAVVTTTDHSHPDTQCRLDTYYQGALCQVDELSDVDQDDETVGVCNRDSGDTSGVRPLCWFAPTASL